MGKTNVDNIAARGGGASFSKKDNATLGPSPEVISRLLGPNATVPGYHPITFEGKTIYVLVKDTGSDYTYASNYGVPQGLFGQTITVVPESEVPQDVIDSAAPRNLTPAQRAAFEEAIGGGASFSEMDSAAPDDAAPDKSASGPSPEVIARLLGPKASVPGYHPITFDGKTMYVLVEATENSDYVYASNYGVPQGLFGGEPKITVVPESEVPQDVIDSAASAPTVTMPDYTGDADDPSEGVAPRNAAFNEYYNDLYSLQKGTSGRAMYDRLGQSYENAAENEMYAADAMLQTQAMQQAQVIKSITDQIRSERTARLRAGMSTSQIANQDMQMMMANVGALNEQTQLQNQARFTGVLNKRAAKDLAYEDYLAASQGRGQVAAAFYAGDGTNLNWATAQEMARLYGSDSTKWSPENWTATQERVSGAATQKYIADQQYD